MEQSLLTARAIYRLLVRGGMNESRNVTFISCVTHYTLSHFWWAFLSECVPDSILTPYFETKQKRNRALSNLMNRSVPHSMPVKLYQSLEAHLSVEELSCLVSWMSAALDQDVHPRLMHEALDRLEEETFKTDPEAAALSGFFGSLHISREEANNTGLKKLHLQAALRVTLLGLHALYGDHMNDSAALNLLRSSRACNSEMLWTLVAERAPRINGHGFSHVRAAELAQANANTLPVSAETVFRMALPPEEIRAGYADETAGWYAVANWTDLSISVNTYPLPSYDGGGKLGEVENGTIVYVLSAPGYLGLHVSAGVWGRIFWHGQLAYIPMNLMVKLKT